jgi:hypothetical protein
VIADIFNIKYLTKLEMLPIKLPLTLMKITANIPDALYQQVEALAQR